MKIKIFFIFILFVGTTWPARILFDYTKSETAGNADWVVDHDYPYPYPPNPTSPTSWDGAISSWGYALYRAGHQIATLTRTYGITYGNSNNPFDLSKYDVFIMVEPQNPLTTAERDAILNFINNGGGFFMVADHNSSDRDNDGWDSPRVLNAAFENYLGVHFNVTGESPNSWSGVSSNINRDPSNPIYNGPFGYVNSIGFWSGTCITLRPNINPQVYGLVWVSGANRDNDSIMFFYGYYGRGKFVGLGDSSPCDDGTGDPADNLYNNWGMYSDSTLILNATVWLIGSTMSVGECSSTGEGIIMRKSDFDQFVNLKNVRVFDAFGREVNSVKEGLYFLQDEESKQLRKVVVFK